MKQLLTVLLLTLALPLSLSVSAESKKVKICDKSYNCRIVTITNYSQNQSNDALLNAIANSGSKNFETINRGWNPQQYQRNHNY